MHCRRKRRLLVLSILNTHCKALNTLPVKHYNIGLGIEAAHKKACTDLLSAYPYLFVKAASQFLIFVTSLNSLSRKKCMTG